MAEAVRLGHGRGRLAGPGPADGGAGTGGPAGPEDRDDLVLLQPRAAREPGVLARLADVDHDEGLVAGLGVELGVDGVGVEAGHRAGHQARRAHADDEVADLQAGVQGGRAEPEVLALEDRLGALEVRELGGQVLVELGVVGQHRDQRRGQGLGLVPVRHVPDQALAGLGRADQGDPQRLHVHRGRAVLDQVVDRGDLVVADRLVGEGVGGARLAEQQVLRGLVQLQKFGRGAHGGFNSNSGADGDVGVNSVEA